MADKQTEMRLAVGKAIEKYGLAEAGQADVLKLLLKIRYDQAAVVFYSVQNIRGRNSMIQSLIETEYGEQARLAWKKFASFLQTLADVRNALVHWGTGAIVHFDEAGDVVVDTTPVLMNPTNPLGRDPLGVDFVHAFTDDCEYIWAELRKFVKLLKKTARVTSHKPPSPEKFQLPNLRQNLASLTRPQSPKGQ